MRRSVRNLTYILSGDVLSRLLGFVVTTYLAQVLGVGNLGLIGFAMAALSYGLIATDLGLLKLGTREVAKDRSQVRAYVAGVMGLRLVLAFIAFVGLGVFAVAIPKPDATKLMIFSYALALFPVSLMLDWLFQGIEEMAHIAVSRLLMYVSYLVLVLVLVTRPEHVYRVPFLWLAGSGVAAGYLLVAGRIRIGEIRISLNLRFWGLLLQAGLPLGVGTVLAQVYMNFGLIALGLLAGNEATGLYTAAFRVVYFVLIVDRVFYTVVFPIVARRVRSPAQGALTREQAYQESGRTMQQLAKLVLIVALPVAFGTMALARPIITLVFNEQFAPAAPVLGILGWLVVTTTLNSLYAYGLIAAGREREYARNTLAGTAIVVILSLLLVYQLDAAGAAIALLAGETVMLGYMFTGFRRVIRLNPAGYAVRPMLVSLVLSALLWRFPPQFLADRFQGWLPGLPVLALGRLALIAQIILAIAIYSGIMYLVGGIGKQELALLRDPDAPRRE
jgi:O-antigen/teichoic acid export membrane protein